MESVPVPEKHYKNDFAEIIAKKCLHLPEVVLY